MIRHYVRLLVMIVLTAVASLWLAKSLIPTAAAESEQKPVEEQTPLVEPQPALTLLQTGEPQSTTPLVTKPADTIFHWTPTGVGDTQDIYDIRVATTATPDPLTGELKTDVVKANEAPLTTAQYDATDLAGGTYYWQVRSCSATVPLACHDWSEVWTLNVDAIAPEQPTAEFTSAPYSQTVSFAGQAEALSTVTVAVDDKTCVTAAAEDGTWSCTFKDEFEYGDYIASVMAADKAGNESPVLQTNFSIKELFVAPVIAMETLPPVLDIVPVDETPENKTIQQPATAVIDTVNMAATDVKPVSAAVPTPTVKPLSTEGGIVQSSENGWQIFGLPWFLWAGSAAGITGAVWAFGVPIPRRLTSILSL